LGGGEEKSYIFLIGKGNGVRKKKKKGGGVF